MPVRDWILNTFFSTEVRRRETLAAAAFDDSRDRLLSGGRVQERDRWDCDREELLAQALEAWRTNPLARRIVELTSQYVVGGGISFRCPHAHTRRFLHEFWNHRLNRMDMRVFELCDELTRSGEIFLLLSTDPSGMSYLRAVPAQEILSIDTAGNDLEQELAYHGRDAAGSAPVWPAYDPENDDGRSPVMLHYAVNRAVGTGRGESDLAPLLRWLGRYSAWLEDRARLNRYRFAFLYAVTLKGSTLAERTRRQAELNARPPAPGSLLVKDESEEWEVLNPQLEAGQSGEDGLALKKMISAGAGVPLHFLAEPESATRTTAESAGGPTFRRYEQRQEYFLWLLHDLLQAAMRRAAANGRRVNPEAEIEISGADVSARDNAALAVAASTAVGAFSALHDRSLIDDAELLRLAYRFAGETVDVEGLLARAKPGRRKGQRPRPTPRPAGIKSAPDGVSGGQGAARWESA